MCGRYAGRRIFVADVYDRRVDVPYGADASKPFLKRHHRFAFVTGNEFISVDRDNDMSVISSNFAAFPQKFHVAGMKQVERPAGVYDPQHYRLP
jgi:hypothetical protein